MNKLKTHKEQMIFVVAGLLALLFINCTTDPAATKKLPSATVKDGTQPKLYKVVISQMKFNPSEIQVEKGDKIVFENADMVTHDITEEKNKSWTSSPLKPGESWTLVVTESAGYYCSFHPVMKGTIAVE